MVSAQRLKFYAFLFDTNILLLPVAKFEALADLDAVECLSTAASHVLGGMLRLHSQSRAWHYGVLLSSENPHSLSQYLGITLNEFKSVLKVCGLLQKRGGARLVPCRTYTFVFSVNR